MEYPNLIPGIAEKIKAVLKRLRLKPEILPEKLIEKTQSRKHRYSSVCLTEQGEKVIFYAGLHKSDYQRGRMATEVKIARTFIKEKNEIFPYFPKYFQAGEENDFGWLTRQYFPDFPVEDKEKVEKLKKPLAENDLRQLAKAAAEMSEIPIKKFPFLKFFDSKKIYYSLKKAKELKEKKFFSENEIKILKNLFEQNKKAVNNQDFFSHGDFQIGNILLFDQTLKIIDLESAQLNNFAYDISFFTGRLWQDGKERQKIIKYYFDFLPDEKKAAFPALFRINSFFIGLDRYYSKPLEYSQEELEKRKNYFQNFLHASIAGFEQLANFVG